MISTTPAETEFWINTGRPTIASEEGRIYWQRFHDLLKSSPVPITVNGSYPYIESVLAGTEWYSGGGFAYKFWFESAEDRDSFVQEMIYGQLIINKRQVAY